MVHAICDALTSLRNVLRRTWNADFPVRLDKKKKKKKKWKKKGKTRKRRKIEYPCRVIGNSRARASLNLANSRGWPVHKCLKSNFAASCRRRIFDSRRDEEKGGTNRTGVARWYFENQIARVGPRNECNLRQRRSKVTAQRILCNQLITDFAKSILPATSRIELSLARRKAVTERRANFSTTTAGREKSFQRWKAPTSGSYLRFKGWEISKRKEH